jgi:hypothetical protein
MLKSINNFYSNFMSNLTFPIFVFGSLVGLLIGAIFHLIAGGKPIRLIFCLIFGWVGFWVGNYLSQRFGMQIFQYGQISYGISIIFSIILAGGGYWLSGENLSDPGL